MSPVVSSKNESDRLFKSDFLEFFTHIHWSVPLILFVPLVVFCLYRAVAYSSPAALIVYFLAGIFSWSFLEYLMHRFLFHLKPWGPRSKRILYLMHEVHHAYPNDASRLVMPPLESVPMAIFLYWLLSTYLPLYFFYPFFAGMVTGYLTYDMIHYATHHLPMKNPIGKFLKQYHLRHHFSDEKRGFGVSSPFWDFVFRT